jgi:hypothetical protein
LATIPVRNLAERGILRDPHPYDLPPNAFTNGSNVRFEVGKARRAPIFRTVQADLSKDPQHVVGYQPSTGFDVTFVGCQDGSILKLNDSTLTDVTPTGRALGSSAAPWTSTFSGDVLYLNRPSHVPAALRPADSRFVALPNWDATHRCRSLRAFKDVLFAINLTRGVDAYPTSFRWSDVALAGQVPRSWDPTDLSTVANEVLLAQLDSPLVDGLPLKNAMILYSGTQVLTVEYTGSMENAGQNLFVNRTIFTEGGMIAPNCAVEVEGKHYVFGVNDLYVHDGTAKDSIADGRVREWVFKNLNARLSDRCFVQHMPRYNEVLFGFVSGDSGSTFRNPTRCNRAAVFNYVSGAWSFGDLPNVSGGTLVNLDQTLTWRGAGQRKWGGTGGTWYDLKDGFEKHVLFAASSLAGGAPSHRLLAYDHMDRGALAQPFDESCNGPAFLERIGIDLDEAGSDLATYKICKRIYPQVSTYRDTPLQIQVGSSMTPAGPVAWGPKTPFDPKRDYKVDMRQGGRYLAIRFFLDTPADFEISGFDAEVVTGGRR